MVNIYRTGHNKHK